MLNARNIGYCRELEMLRRVIDTVRSKACPCRISAVSERESQRDPICDCIVMVFLASDDHHNHE